VYIVYIDLFTMENRVVNMQITIQDVLPASIPHSNTNNNTGGAAAWTVIDNTNYSNPVYGDISTPVASGGGTITFGSSNTRTIADTGEFTPSWKR